MAIRDTENTEMLFISDPPDWSEGIEIEMLFQTRIWQGRQGTEQRRRVRMWPRFKQTYILTALTAAEYALRRTRTQAELQTTVCVPLWALGYTFNSRSTRTFNLAESVAEEELREDQWFYIDDGTESGFYRIDSIGASSVTVKSSYSSFPSFAAGARLYPCLIGTRVDGEAGFSSSHQRSNDEIISIEGL